MTRDTFDLFKSQDRGRFGDNETPPHTDDDSQSTSFTLIEHYDTGKAIKVSEDGVDARAFWLPHSKIDIRRTTKQSQLTLPDGQKKNAAVIEVTIPNWLAKEKGLI